MARRFFVDNGFRCRLYTAKWNPGRVMTAKAATFRFEVRAEGPGRPIVFNVDDPAEALALARRYAGLMPVYVRDRSMPGRYLTEAHLEHLASGGGADHA